MKYVDEYRDPAAARSLLARIRSRVTRPWTLMEVCGGQTHSIVQYGLDQLTPEEITLIHGPGCPVCVTPETVLDQAAALALRPGVTLCSFGDMLRVPGRSGSLLDARQRGGDVRIVYSPLDAVELARQHPDREVVFLAIGFETTAPLNAMAVRRAAELELENYSVLVSQVTVPPAVGQLLSHPECRVDGLLAAGHVCTVMGTGEYHALAERFGLPIVVTGFEPLDILLGIDACVAMLEAGAVGVRNAYPRSVRAAGNPHALACLSEVFQPADQEWRGLGTIPDSGLVLAPAYRAFDAAARFALPGPARARETDCISGAILQGLRKPEQCPAFGVRCTPDAPLGATMVSAEGACHAYYTYRPRPAAGS